MEIDCLGLNLNILIISDRSSLHEWASFVSWYSISKMAPDAKVNIYFNKTGKENFSWVKKMGLEVGVFPGSVSSVQIHPFIMMVRPLDDAALKWFNDPYKDDFSELVGQVKSDTFLSFIDYGDGCGNFVVEDWLNRLDCPLDLTDSFMTHDATVNEVKILSLWRQAQKVYSAISRG